MKESKKGGKRAGAGRKPVENPKVQVTVYLEKRHVDQFGGLADAKIAICEFARDWEVRQILKQKPEVELKFTKPQHEKARKAVISHISDKSAEIALQDTTVPNKTVKPITDPKPQTNYAVDTRPKTLQEIKDMCPKELTGFDRSQWIATERQKYGI